MSNPQPQQNPQQTPNLALILSALTAGVLALYTAAQLDVIRKFAALITKYGLGDLLLSQMRKASTGTVQVLHARTPTMVEQVIARAASDGVNAAGPGAPVNPTFGIAGDTFESHAERSARAITEDLIGKLNGLEYRITRFSEDVYQSVVADAARSEVLGLPSALAQHDAYRALISRGIDGFTDARGRNWELSAYVDMAVRTAAQRAFNVSHLDRMLSIGVELFTVPGDGHPCPLCLPFENAILSVAPDPRADATIAEATAAGVWHANCRHVLVAYFPGVTEIPAPHVWTPEDQARYAESQQQRALERAIRAAKRELEGAFTPEMKTQAQFAVRRAQANMRAFIDLTGRVRVSRREQLTL